MPTSPLYENYKRVNYVQGSVLGAASEEVNYVDVVSDEFHDFHFRNQVLEVGIRIAICDQHQTLLQVKQRYDAVKWF